MVFTKQSAYLESCHQVLRAKAISKVKHVKQKSSRKRWGRETSGTNTNGHGRRVPAFFIQTGGKKETSARTMSTTKHRRRRLHSTEEKKRRQGTSAGIRGDRASMWLLASGPVKRSQTLASSPAQDRVAGLVWKQPSCAAFILVAR